MGTSTLPRTSKMRDSRNSPWDCPCRPVEETIDPHGNGWADTPAKQDTSVSHQRESLSLSRGKKLKLGG